MAKPKPISILLLVTFCTLTFDFVKTQTFSKALPPSSLGLNQEKLTHLQFYFHDIVSGRNPTAVKVAESVQTNTSKTLFGSVFIMDDPLTVLPELSSKKIGFAQGMYSSASQTELGLLMVLNFVFTEGEYNGSTISILGHNAVFSGIREMPVVGGSGAFRFARGYAQAKTFSFDANVGDAVGNAVVEYNVFVLHPLQIILEV